ncbi:hypothetical protein ACC862_38025, partial [Rhizobium ruizarguesonis]
ADVRQPAGEIGIQHPAIKRDVAGNLKLTINPAALPAAVTSKLDGQISLESQVGGTIPSKFALSNLVLKSSTLEAAGNVA